MRDRCLLAGFLLLASCTGADSPTQPDRPPAVASVDVTPATATLRRGQTLQLVATPKDAAGQALASRALTWSSSPDSVLTVTSTGLVSTKGLGSATVTATSEGRSGQATILVTPVPVAAVTVTPDTSSVMVGRTLQLMTTVTDSAGNTVSDRSVSWASSDTTRARVSTTGLVTPVAPGIVTIGASAEGKTGQARVTVLAVPVASVGVTPSAPRIEVGSGVQLTATVRDSAGNVLPGRGVTWSTSDPAKARVSTGGFAEALASGTAVLTAMSEGRSGSIVLTIDPLPNGIAAADSASLSRHLARIAATSSWVQPSVDTANAIMARAGYTEEQWRSFFTAYFSTRPLTAPLAYYIRHPLLYWFGETVNRRLQAGLFPVAAARVEAALLAHPVDLERALETDTLQAATFSGFLDLMGDIAESGMVAGRKEEVARLAARIVQDYPSYVFGEVSEVRAMRRLVAFAWMGVLLAEPLSATRKAAVASTLRLSAWQSQMLERHSVLVDERFSISGAQGRLNAGQQAVIGEMLRLVPAGLHDLQVLTVTDAFGLFPNFFHCCFYTRYRNRSVISIAELTLDPVENPFPADVAPRPTPLFSTILVHELNHVVDNVLYARDAKYKQRRDALIAAAGDEPLNYLRSMIERGFFRIHPAETFSSISQQWLADSEQALRLGRQRFDGGRREPLNQALWIAEVYSGGGSSTPLYRMTDPSGAMARIDAAVTRDGAGHINTLVAGDSTYAFVREANGNVVGYTIRANR